jgi:hypothetical protein
VTIKDASATNEVGESTYIQRAQRELDPWAVLKGVWRREYPPGHKRSESLTIIVRLVATPVLLVRRLSPSILLRKRGPDAIDLMVLSWTGLTTVILVFGQPSALQNTLLRWSVLAFAWFRLIDTLSQKLMEILLHSLRQPLFAGVQRSIVLGALNLYEIIAAFAIIYLACGGVYRDVVPLSSATDALYFSMVTAFTVGFGDFTPKSREAQQIVMAEIGLVAVYFLAWFPRAVSLLFPEKEKS